MKLTQEQREAVEYERNALVVACPGSGKTRTIVAKLLQCVATVRETARRIACITYTNAAVHEIESRLRTLGAMGDEELCEISTIHSFCLTEILRPFAWRLESYPNGFEVLCPDDDRYRHFVDEVREVHGLDSRETDNFPLLNRAPDGTPILTGSLTRASALDFWGRLREQNFIDFPNIVYESYRLLIEYPRIAQGLACKLAWILVDEFQDTSALQIQWICGRSSGVDVSVCKLSPCANRFCAVSKL